MMEMLALTLRDCFVHLFKGGALRVAEPRGIGVSRSECNELLDSVLSEAAFQKTQSQHKLTVFANQIFPQTLKKAERGNKAWELR